MVSTVAPHTSFGQMTVHTATRTHLQNAQTPGRDASISHTSPRPLCSGLSSNSPRASSMPPSIAVRSRTWRLIAVTLASLSLPARCCARDSPFMPSHTPGRRSAAVQERNTITSRYAGPLSEKLKCAASLRRLPSPAGPAPHLLLRGGRAQDGECHCGLLARGPALRRLRQRGRPWVLHLRARRAAVSAGAAVAVCVFSAWLVSRFCARESSTASHSRAERAAATYA